MLKDHAREPILPHLYRIYPQQRASAPQSAVAATVKPGLAGLSEKPGFLF